jgi:hypothetical protein
MMSNLADIVPKRKPLKRCWDCISLGNWAMSPVPVDDLCASGSPYACVTHDMAQRLVQTADAEWLADKPGVQVQH